MKNIKSLAANLYCIAMPLVVNQRVCKLSQAERAKLRQDVDKGINDASKMSNPVTGDPWINYKLARTALQ